MSSVNPRATRFRRIASQSGFIPPPLPLIQLPDESRFAQTGLSEERPMYLPVRKHIPNIVAATPTLTLFDVLERPTPEPIFQEDCAMVDAEAQEYNESEVLERLDVYEYNQPRVFISNNAPDDTLIFDSLFESGNLLRAVRVFRKVPTSSHVSQEYELLIHPDVKNGAYRQWFYFEVRNGRPKTTYRFALVNLSKSGALFGQGLQPVAYSEHDAAAKGMGWRHRGTHVRYDVAKSPLAPPGGNALTFHYEFEHSNDCVYFACLQPYTYTDLMDYLEQLERDPHRTSLCRRTELCRTLAGNSCDLLSITSPDKFGLALNERRIIVLSARVHPGEPNSSWMMKGMLDYLTGPSSEATILRENFIFKVVPMLNPDGVINGNTRVSLAGWDLNRVWSQPIEQLFPTIYHLKQQLAHYQSCGRTAIYCDLHGHSLNRNIFMYGCSSTRRKGSSSDGGSLTNTATGAIKLDPRVFPMIVARQAPCFSFSSCNFSVHRSKLTTARVVVNQELGVTNSYTLEASFCGPDFGTNKDTQFSTYDLEEMGRTWCQSILVYYGLTFQAKALETKRAKLAAIEKLRETMAEELLFTSRQSIEGQDNEALMQDDAEDEGSCCEKGLLFDCEAAVSALVADSNGNANDRMDSDEDDVQDLDLSGAKGERVQFNVEHELNGKRLFSTNDPFLEKTIEKKREKKKLSRLSKSKSVLSQLTVKGGKATARKKRKNKPKITRSTSAKATSPLHLEFEVLPASELAELTTRRAESASKAPVNQTRSILRTKSMSARPKCSSKISRNVSSALLQGSRNTDLRASSMSAKTSLLVLPSVFLGSNRILKTAPTFNRNFLNRDEDQMHFNLTRLRAELPVLPLSSRNQDLRRRKSRRRTPQNGDI